MKKVLRYTIIILVIAAVSIFSFYYWGTYDDDGVKAGRIISLSHKGVIFKTYEGKIDLGAFGALKGASPIAESFDFSVEDDPELIKEIQEVALTGENVNLHYIKRYAVFPWRGDTKNFAISIERLDKKK